MKEESRMFLHSPLILSLKLLGLFPINPDTLETSRRDVVYSSILALLSIFELNYTPFFIFYHKTRLFPANFPSTTAARIILSCIASLSARFTSIFLMNKYFRKINKHMITSNTLLNTFDHKIQNFKHERLFFRSRFFCFITLLVLIFLDANRLHHFIVQSNNIYHILFYIYFIVFQNWSILGIEVLFLTTAQQLNLNFLKINVELETILKEATAIETRALNNSFDNGRATTANRTNSKEEPIKTSSHKQCPVKSPYFWPDLRKISDDLMEISVKTVTVPIKFPTHMHDQVKRLFHIYIRCSKALHSLNDLFQIQLLFSLLRLFCVSFLVVYQHISRYISYECLYSTLIYVYIAVVIFRFILIIAAAYFTTFQAQYTKVLISKINNRFLDADTKEELELFWNHITSSKLEFTACGFFTLNTRLIASAFVAGTTYLVILLQFNPEKQHVH